VQKVATLDRGLAYGEGCFETFRVIDGAVFALAKHQQRLSRAAAEFGWSINGELLLDDAIEAGKREGNDLLMRVTLTGGAAPWGVLPPRHSSATTWLQSMPTPARAPLHLRMVDCGNTVLRSRDVKRNADYADTLRIYQQSRHQLSHGEQILLCGNDKIISTMTANVIIYHQGQWITPANDHLLTGITRSVLLQQGLIVIKPCCQTLAQSCQAMACINSGVFIQPVAAVNGRSLAVRHHAFKPLYDFFKQQQGVPSCL